MSNINGLLSSVVEESTSEDTRLGETIEDNGKIAVLDVQHLTLDINKEFERVLKEFSKVHGANNVKECITLLESLGFTLWELKRDKNTPVRLSKAIWGKKVFRRIDWSDRGHVAQKLQWPLQWSRNTPLHLATREGPLSDVEKLLEGGADVNARGAQDHTPLYCACLRGDVHVIRLLLEQDRIDIEAADRAGWTQLHLASWYHRFDVAKLLVERGADVDARTRFGETSLHFAAHNGHVDTVKELLVRKLNGLPLAIEAANKELCESQCHVEEYLREKISVRVQQVVTSAVIHQMERAFVVWSEALTFLSKIKQPEFIEADSYEIEWNNALTFMSFINQPQNMQTDAYEKELSKSFAGLWRWNLIDRIEVARKGKATNPGQKQTGKDVEAKLKNSTKNGTKIFENH